MPGSYVPSPAERGLRMQAQPDPEQDPWVQVNVRMRRSQKNALDARRKVLSLSRDEWIRRVVTWALINPPGTPVHRERHDRDSP